MADAVTNPDLEIRIRGIKNEVAAVRQAIRSTTKVRRMILLLLVLFIVGVTMLFFQLVKRVQAPEFRQEALTLAQEHIQLNSDTYAAEMQKLAEAATPVLTNAMKEQAQRDADRYSEVIASERDRLVKRLRPKLNEMVEARYDVGLKGLDELLAEEFPEARDPVVQERLRESLRVSMKHMVEQYYLDEMETLVDSAIVQWDAFPAADAPAAGDPSAVNQFIGCLLEMLSRVLSRDTLSS